MEQTLIMAEGGKIQFHREGTGVHILAERPNDGRGLYKVWLYGEKGSQFLLGTLVPEASGLKLCRTIPVRELERCGCWPVKGGAVKLAFPFEHKRWHCEQHPELLLCDPILSGQIDGAMMCCREKGEFSLAVPFSKDSPVMLNTIFCFGRVERLDGKPYIIWRFDSSGRPLAPE